MAVTVRTLQNFIAGEWVDATSGEAREIVSPVTGEKLADAPNASEEDVVRAARAERTSGKITADDSEGTTNMPNPTKPSMAKR